METGITTKPADIKEWDVLYLRGIRSSLKIANADMKNANNPTIPEWMWISVICLMRSRHKVHMISQIQ
jgi:hypothetical protein